MKLRHYAWVFLLCLLAALFTKQYMRRQFVQKPGTQATPPTSKVKREVPPTGGPTGPTDPQADAPDGPGDIRVADDADSKRGDFWIEQKLQFGANGVVAVSKKDVVDLWVGIDPAKLSGLRVRLSAGAVHLEHAESENKFSEMAKAAIPAIEPGEIGLGALWRRNELSIWLGPHELFKWTPTQAQRAWINGPSAFQSLGNTAQLGARSTLALGAVKFDDNFMRDSGNGAWRPQFGRWELTALAFPERSANPFSLRCTYGSEPPSEDALYRGRVRYHDFGLGIVLSQFEGTLHVERITGGSPAARAGLQEDDIFLAVDGLRIEDCEPWQLYQMLQRGFGGETRLTMLRPGEQKPRQFVINRENFRWGTPAVATVIQPETQPGQNFADAYSLITAGHLGWSDYMAEVAVKPLGSGGVGLAIAVTSPKDYLLFRWRGPADRNAPATPQNDKLQLVRVKNGVETILAEKDSGYRSYEFYRLAVDWNGDDVTCLIDGNIAFQKKVPDLKRGQVGLYSLKGEPCFFDDVHVATDRPSILAAHHPERALNNIFIHEDDMEVWANPALEWDRDVKTGWAVHKSRFPGEQAIVISKPKFNELTIALYCGNNPDDRRGTLTIKDGNARLEGTGWESAQIRLPQGQIQRIAVRASSAGAEADIDGVRLRAASNIKPEIPTGGSGKNDRVAIRGLKNLGDPKSVRLSSSNILEYTFDTAPVDWKVLSGRWGLLNKWICDPRWSWFGGRTKTVAQLWNKFVFAGDLSVDAHVALMMQQEDPPFERPGDYNITICGDGENVDSGYTLIFGGDGNSWTRLYRKGKLVAESNKEEHRIFSDRIRHPDKPELHQRWFHIRFEKIGNVLSFYRDENLAFTFSDPEPLPDGRIGFWTMDNGFLLSRVRIAHGGIAPAPFEPRKANYYSDARVINVFDGEVGTSVERVALPKGIEESLKNPGEKFQSAEAEPLAKNTSPPPAIPTATQAWRVTNASGGGPFSLQWKATVINPDTKGIVRFAYCIEPGAMVDLYLLDVSNLGERGFDPRHQTCFRWRMTGPQESDEFAPLAGEIPDIKADGRWHTVQFDVQPTWRDLWRRRGYDFPRQYVLRLMVGNLDNHGYLLSGMTGNHAGASYAISDISVFSPEEIDKTAPKISRVIWPYDADGDGRTISVVFDDANGSGILEQSLQVSINDIAITRDSRTFDHTTQTLKIDALRTNLKDLSLEPKWQLKLLGYQDRAQNAGASFEASYVFDVEKAKAAAKPVMAPDLGVNIVGALEIVPDSPLNLNDVVPIKPIARLQDSKDAPPWAPAGQQRSLNVVGIQDGSAFGFQMRQVSYSLRNWPYIQFDYKIPFETPVNMHFMDAAGSVHALILTDTGDERDPLSADINSRGGPPEGLVADGTWRSLTIPIVKIMNSELWPSSSAEIRSIDLHDNGWRGNRRGMNYWIHRLQPLAAGRADQLRFHWQGWDISGINDYASCIDDKPETDPQGKQDVASGDTLDTVIKRLQSTGTNAIIKDGWNYLHVRVRNGAGVWSSTSHLKFFMDSTGPRLARTEPSAGSTYAGQGLKIYFDEEHGVDFATMKLKINGRPVNTNWTGFNINYRENSIIYNAALMGMPWNDGEVKVEIDGLRDLIGNASPPLSFAFTADRTKDTTGPEISHIRFTGPNLGSGQHRQLALESSFGLDFEEHCGHVHAIKDCSMEWLDNPNEACFGRRAVRFTALEDDADVQVMLHRNPWYIDRSPLLHFDYKVDPGMKVDLLVEALGEWMTIQFTGDGAAPPGGKSIGKVGGVESDGKWHHASVDLRALIDAAKPDFNIRIVNKIMLSAQGRDGCKRGATLSIDNLDMLLPSAAGARFEWDAQDPSGISGYWFAMDQNAVALPEEPLQINVAQPIVPIGGKVGVWYAHIKARDGAGNWGQMRTVRVDFGR